MIDFKMPALGADMELGTLVEWLVKPGDAVAPGGVVAVVETQKGAIEIETFAKGRVVDIVVPVGEKVPVGKVLAHIDDGKAPAAPSPAPLAPPVAVPAPPPVAPPAVKPPPAPPAGAAGRIEASPVARRRAVELGLDPSRVERHRPARIHSPCLRRGAPDRRRRRARLAANSTPRKCARRSPPR